jgi:2-methylcitrate dehydratase PrpD
MLELIAKHGIRADEVRAIEVGFLPGSDTALVSLDPQTGLEGKFSIEYCAAATVLDGKLTLESFTDIMVQRPPVRELIKKVRRYRIASDKVYSGVVGYTDIAIDTARGRFEMRVERTPGSPAWPMTEQDRIEKFMDCAGRVLGEPAARRLLGLAQSCATLPDIRELLRATVPAAGKSAAAREPQTAR